VGLGLKGSPLDRGDLVRITSWVEGVPLGAIARISRRHCEDDLYSLEGYEYVRVKAVELELLSYLRGPDSLGRVELQRETVDLSALARVVAEELTMAEPERNGATFRFGRDND
jgi:hypothetical protein